MGTLNQTTGMVSEFYVLSVLLRCGINANLTLGNQKKVDIIVNNKGVAMTIDVKGLKSSGDFIIGNYFESKDDKNHFYIFVYYSDFENIKENPELFVVPATEISAIVKERESVNNVSIASLREKYSKDFSDAVKIFK
ncbi:hypothetical protein [Treponema berlinense]|uniref:hypothetical protein n=1 Tax=Treponema berlinense TaxID=225004 RepID=UPI002357CB11|nr:hypothetical protein [Treponema berlinense]